nr:hypothetical protein [Tanacetum cinerariifolium]
AITVEERITNEIKMKIEEKQVGMTALSRKEKAKKNNGMAAQVNSGFDEHFNRESPFDMGYENVVGFNQSGNVDQKLVATVFQEMMKMFKGKDIMKEKASASSSYAHATTMSCFTASFTLFCHPDINLLLD